MRRATTKGFERTSKLLQDRIRVASESRGFAESRVLTHWAEIVGDDVAAIARPVDVKFGRQGFGATLTVLTTGAHAPMLEMQKEALRQKVNAVYGYNAIARLRITQTAPSGFADGRVEFGRPADSGGPTTRPTPEMDAPTAGVVGQVDDENLRAALELLGRNILSKPKPPRKG